MNNSELIVISHCKNCSTNVEHHKYCPNCGAKKITKRITFRNLLNEISEVYLNADNTVFRTFKDLTIKPHVVIEGYINGVRKKHLNVISYLLISLSIGTISSYLLSYLIDIDIQIEEKKIKHEYIEYFIEVVDKLPLLGYFTLILPCALISRYIFRKYKKYNSTEHIIINTFLISHSTLLYIIPYFIAKIYYINTGLILIFVIYLYSIFLFKNLYQISYKEVFKKGVRFFLIITTIVILTVVIMGLIDGFQQHN